VPTLWRPSPGLRPDDGRIATSENDLTRAHQQVREATIVSICWSAAQVQHVGRLLSLALRTRRFDRSLVGKRLLPLLLVAVLLAGCTIAVRTPASSIADEAAIAQAFNSHRSGVEVTGSGVVERLLPDDDSGGRHQRFILRLTSGQTLLVAHNVDIASRVQDLKVGDTVQFKGQYEWNSQGGVIHWTHHDPTGTHQLGWLKHGGKLYE